MPINRRGRYRPSSRFDHGLPIATLGLAPFAGVLLIMMLVFAALRPPVTHAIVVDLPAPLPEWETGVLTPPVNLVAISNDGQIRWNGTPVSERQFRDILSSAADDSPQPALLFAPDANAAYGRVLGVMEIIRRAGLIDRCFRFSGIARYRKFERPYDPEELLPYEQQECLPYFY